MACTLKRKVHPLNYTGPQRTYFEIVNVKDGVAICNTEFAKMILLQSRDYELIEMGPAEEETTKKKGSRRRTKYLEE